MNNIKSFDEFTVDNILLEGLSSMDFIKILMEEEHENGYDLATLDEGWSFGSKGRKGDKTFRFSPGKNDTDVSSTEIFSDDKKFKYYEVLLPKTTIQRY